MATPVNRLVERIEHRSIRCRSTWARWAESSLFILTIILDRLGIVKHCSQFNDLRSVGVDSTFAWCYPSNQPETCMDIEFRDSRLSLIETDRAMETRLPVSVITSCRHKLVVLRAAPDERTLRNWKSLHYEKLEGDRSGQRSIRLNKQWRLVFTLNSDLTPPRLTVLSVEDYH